MNTTPAHTFSFFLPRIDTRSLPDMALASTREDYLEQCKATVTQALVRRGLGTPSSVHLVPKHTSDGYLFFIGFVHYPPHPTAGEYTPAVSAFRLAVNSGEARIDLGGGRYWKAQKYVPSQQSPTLLQQHRLHLGADEQRLGALPAPILRRAPGGAPWNTP